MIGWYCPNKFQCNILSSQFELSPLHHWLLKYEEKNGVRGEIWGQNMTNSISLGKLKDEIN